MIDPIVTENASRHHFQYGQHLLAIITTTTTTK